MPAALDAGRIDAALITEPFLTVATKTARVLGYGYDGISKHFLVGAWVAAPQWASAHADLVKRFQAVMHDTAVWANANQAKTGDILAKDLKFDPALVATMVRARYTEQLTPALMQPLIDVSAKFNGFKSFPAQELIYTRLALIRRGLGRDDEVRDHRQHLRPVLAHRPHARAHDADLRPRLRWTHLENLNAHVNRVARRRAASAISALPCPHRSGRRRDSMCVSSEHLHRQRGGVPAAGDQLPEERRLRGLRIEVKRLRIVLARERYDRFLSDRVMW